MTTYSLHSTPGVYTPGLIAWAINSCHFVEDRDTIMDMICATFAEVPREAMTLIVLEGHPYKVEGETVTFTVEGN